MRLPNKCFVVLPDRYVRYVERIILFNKVPAKNKALKEQLRAPRTINELNMRAGPEVRRNVKEVIPRSSQM